MKLSKNSIRILIAAIIFAACLIMEYLAHVDSTVLLITALVGYVLVSADVIYEMLVNFRHGKFFDEVTLMSVASIGAFFVGSYTEALAVMLFFQIGEIIEDRVVGRSRSSVKDLMCLQQDTANLIDGDDITLIETETLNVGDIIMIRPGEKVPVDSIVISGSSAVDMKNLTGESVPKDVSSGDELLSGSMNTTGAVKAEVIRTSEFSTAAKIEALMAQAEEKKSHSEKFITIFSRYYTPTVIALALIVAIIPPLFFGQDLTTWVYRALIFLVISCPCALVLTVPLAFYCGIGKSSAKGVLIKGSNYIETLSKVDTVVMDKTGTLTKGVFRISKVVPSEISEDELLGLVASLERYSDHPIAAPFKTIDCGSSEVTGLEERSGLGISAYIDGKKVCVGNIRLMKEESIEVGISDVPGISLYVSSDGRYLGRIDLEDEIRPTSKDAVALLRSNNIRTVMLTGDRSDVGRRVANDLGIDTVCAEMMPSDKVSKVEGLLSECKGKLSFVGDGMNDAPSLARSDVGIAMGGLGSDAAIEAADVVILSDEPLRVPETIQIAHAVMRKVWTNTIAALVVKFSFMFLAALGLISMWGGVVADVGLMVVLVLNSVTLLGKGAILSLFKKSARDEEHCECCCHS